MADKKTADKKTKDTKNKDAKKDVNRKNQRADKDVDTGKLKRPVEKGGKTGPARGTGTQPSRS